jgi:hypothetical protein
MMLKMVMFRAIFAAIFNILLCSFFVQNWHPINLNLRKWELLISSNKNDFARDKRVLLVGTPNATRWQASKPIDCEKENDRKTFQDLSKMECSPM